MMNEQKVPQLRFSGFGDEWEEKKLGDSIIEVNERTSDFNKNPLFSLTIENGITAKTERYERSQLVTKEDDLFKVMHPQNFATNPMNLRFGAVGFCKENSDVSVSGYYDVFSIDDNKCSSFWYPYFKTFNSLKKFDDAATGSLIEKRRVHFSILKQLEFLQPSLEEKKKIGSFLSLIDSLIQTKAQKLESLKSVKKSLLQKCFPKDGEKVPQIRFEGFSGNWEEKKLTDEVSLYSGLTYSPNDIIPYGTMVLRSSNVQEGEIDLEDKVTVNPSIVNSQNVEIGDIIVVVRNGSRALIGKHAQIKKEMKNTVIGAFMTGLRSKKPEFLNVLLSTDAFNQEVEKNLGATINQITNATFESMKFYFPSDSEQQKIGQFFSKYDSLISLQQKEIDNLKTIKKSLLQKMFV